ncbi:family 10 glycosylhydrolase [Bacteroidales bacterium OttesenSCG-928-A17]|nr:family 10 glycosylhydrolase [Bacteroidales bacterium OttesenSCG-928-A17]
MKKIFPLLLGLLFLSFTTICAQQPPKREFRGAWIHVIGQNQYKDMSPETMKSYWIGMLDSLRACHVNAIIFQVRPTADALYYSEIEPWSRYLTGTQGEAPEGNFDPMAFMIRECHKRGMEFHAWLNPYRVTASSGDELVNSHVFWKHPEWFVRYGNQIYFDPGLPESRAHICKVVKDILQRYDVDAIHMDDYFYPYPIPGQVFPDEESFNRYGAEQGFAPHQRADWRRNNVNTLIEQLKYTIVLTKPWVRFGISPFGIYRNKKDTPDGSGSDTRGLQNYDDLYADVLLWTEKGWVDYLIPQVYWEIGHSAADYAALLPWWSQKKNGGHLYIGQDVVRSMQAADLQKTEQNQLPAKMDMKNSFPGIDGNCWWPAYRLTDNFIGIADSLKNNHQAYPALIPAFSHMHTKSPKDVKSLKAEWTSDGYILHWKQNGKPYNPETGHYFVIYRFNDKEKVNLNDPSKIICVTGETSYKLPYENGKTKYQYVVTSVDRFHNESKKGKSKKVKL